MTRTEYCTALRKAGFQVRATWHARSDWAEEPGTKDITCYAVIRADGTYVAMMLLHQCGEIGVDVYFMSQNNKAADDIAFLNHVAQQVTA